MSYKVAVPNWKGPEQDGGSTAANGDPFEKNSTKANHGVKLSGGANSFNPSASKPAPISFLNRNSEADDGPVIVSSTFNNANTGTLDKGKGKAVQEPIGTRGENFSPTRRFFFTTDVGPHVVSPGGHYIKIENVDRRELDPTLKILYANVRTRTNHSSRD